MSALRLGRHAFEPHQLLVMAVVTGVSPDPAAALERVQTAVAEGADIVSIGAGPARAGGDGSPREQIGRAGPVITAIRSAHPDLVIAVDTRWHEVVREACAAGADLICGSSGGWDTRLAEAAAEHGAGLVCPPALAARAVAAGVDRARIIIDLAPGAASGGPRRPAPKGAARLTEPPPEDAVRLARPSPEGAARLTEPPPEGAARLADLAGAGWPVLVSLADDEIAGPARDAAAGDPLAGALGHLAVCAWLGARVFRVHQVRPARRALSMVSAIRGDLPPARAVRGLA